MDFLKTGVILNFKAIKEKNPAIWEKYKEHFIGVQIENEEEVYLNCLADKIDGKILFSLLTDCLPEKLRLPL